MSTTYLPAGVRGPQARAVRLLTGVLLALALALSALAVGAPPADAAARSTATVSEYKKIKNGQSLSTVRRIIGGRGTSIGDGGYLWRSTAGKRVLVAFEDGKVVFKDRFAVASLSEYRRIKEGQSYSTVKRIVGGSGIFNIKEGDERFAAWLSPDGERLIVVYFEDGRVTEKERTSLK